MNAPLETQKKAVAPARTTAKGSKRLEVFSENSTDTQDVTRSLPCCIGQEKSVLSSCLQDPAEYIRLAVESGLTPSHFYLPAHSILFDFILGLFNASAEIELVSLRQRLLDRGLLERIGGASLLVDIFSYAPSPVNFTAHLKAIKTKFVGREIIRVSRENIQGIYDSPDEIPETLEAAEKRLLEIRKSASADTKSISVTLADRAFDFDSHPDKPVPIFQLANMPLCTPGNITNIQAPPKAGKSAVVESMLAAVMNGNRIGADTLGFSAENPQGHALIHFDTEQSRFDADALIRRALRRAMIDRPPVWLQSFAVADLGIMERREALRHVMSEASATHGGIFAVLIDGIGDLCADPNDSEEAFSLVHELHTLAIKHHCTIATVLHENPGSESGKTRGHLGSQLERKAETNLRLAKDKDGITTIWAERARHCYLPKEQGPCFAWSDHDKMHTSCGTSCEIKSAAMREKMQGEAETAFNGQGSFRHSDLIEVIGKTLKLKERAAKLRIQKWTAEGIIRKDAAGNYHLTNP